MSRPGPPTPEHSHADRFYSRPPDWLLYTAVVVGGVAFWMLMGVIVSCARGPLNESAA